METVGSIFDKLIILEKRQSQLLKAEDVDKDIYNDLCLQKGWLLKELGRILVDIFDNNRPAMVKKHKQYDKDISATKTLSFVEAIESLKKENHKLWELEDIRRDKKNNLPDDRLDAADKISFHNI